MTLLKGPEPSVRAFPDRINDDIVKSYMQVMSRLVVLDVKSWGDGTDSESMSSAQKTLRSFLDTLSFDAQGWALKCLAGQRRIEFP